jgi:GNAT superfamily N-acetyltransferase
MQEVTYREALPEEGRAVAALLAEIMAHHGVTPPGGEELHRIVQAVMEAPGHTFFVASDPRGLVGMCALLFSVSTWRAVRVCELQDVVVTANARGQDLGRLLVENALRFARARGCAWAYLTAESWNLQAHSFYRALGFEEKAVLYFEKDLSLE